jgi:hypothetical protein
MACVTRWRRGGGEQVIHNFEHLSTHVCNKNIFFHSSRGAASDVSLRYVGTYAGSQNSCLAITPVHA